MVKDRLHVNLPIELLFNEKASINTISNFLASSGSSKSNNNNNSDAQLEAEILADCTLDASIQPMATEFDWSSNGDILLTGATGFLGSYILSSLLEQTGSRIHCPEGMPIRGASKQYSRNEEYHGTNAGCVGIIYHCGAYVNHVQPYEYHKPANVTGTLEIIKFAASTKQKFLNYISTVSVYSQRGKSFHESDTIDNQYFLGLGGYGQSKWVAERLVTAAIDRGFPARVFRPGLIGWSTLSGYLSDVDWLYRLIAGMIALKAAPLSRARLNIIPVDSAGKAIVELGQNPSIYKKSFIFNIVNPQDVAWKDIVSWISSTEVEGPWSEALKALAKPLQFKLWWDFVLMELEKSQQQANQLTQMLMGLMLFSDGIPDEDSHYSLANTVNYLKRQPSQKIDQAMTSTLVKYILSTPAFEKLNK
eukprot:CAMPEP_0168578084 /NCGR_PEP_ID=MMETSP0413-20121227/21142_1 /TAXON_ID=136452 /ORGANISM="Filamoeba nolandi, Strain NC-AS-23-1" /LENGTH=418 /DNA_ID=CAMNT_0008611903 /DNA_START=27 /DNA_END=1282 /DNA_ORIENTATION=+